MAPQFKVLERFSLTTRELIAGRVFNRYRWGTHGRYYACEQGDCVMAALCHAEGTPLNTHTPTDRTLRRKLGVSTSEYAELSAIIEANDKGWYATPEAVRSLLLGAPTEQGE